MKKSRTAVLWFAAALATGLMLAGLEALASSHHSGDLETTRPKVIERQAYVHYYMSELGLLQDGYIYPLLRVRMPDGLRDEPILVNHLQASRMRLDGEYPRLIVEAIRVFGSVVCEEERIEVGPDGDVLAAIDAATNTPCSGAVQAGGPLGSERVLGGQGSIHIKFVQDNPRPYALQIGILSYPGSTVEVQGVENY